MRSDQIRERAHAAPIRDGVDKSVVLETVKIDAGPDKGRSITRPHRPDTKSRVGEQMKERNPKMQVASADKHCELLPGLIQNCELAGQPVVPRLGPSNPTALQNLICLPDAGDDAAESRH
jgi:hypothetical protein